MKFFYFFYSEFWTTYSTQERKLQVFNLGYFRRILGNTCVRTVSSQELVSHPCSQFYVNAIYTGWVMFTGWTMDASPKDLLYGELATTGERLSGRPRLRFKAICKRGMKACNIDPNAWETLADNRNLWKQQVSQGLKSGEAAIVDKSDERRARRITCHQQVHPAPQPASVLYARAGAATVNLGLIGLYSNTRQCSSTKPHGAIP